ATSARSSRRSPPRSSRDSGRAERAANDDMADLTGGQLVARTLRQAGVRHVFTLCGGHILPIYGGCLTEGVGIIDVRHEQAAAHAGDAYARLTRGVGVAIVVPGPGVTDAVTGVANAYAARSSLLLIGGAAPLGLRGLGALQETEQLALLRPITKGAWSVAETRQIPEVLATAIRTALSGRPGPVFVEIPVDLLMTTIEDRLAPIPTGYVHRTRAAVDAEALGRLDALLAGAERPVMMAGGGVYWDDAAKSLASFAERAGVPVFMNGAGRAWAWRAGLSRREAEARGKLDELAATDQSPVSHYRWASEIARVVTRDTIVVGDGGDVVNCAAKFVPVDRPGQWLDPGPLGCLGVGPSFALTAKLLRPDQRVLLVSGDGA